MDNRITRTNRSSPHDQLPSKGKSVSARDRAIKRVGIENAVIQAHTIGVMEERERIIKLLENPNCKPNDHDYNNGCNCDVIALIKGENK